MASMQSSNTNSNKPSLYPKIIIDSDMPNPNPNPSQSSSSSLYPSLDMKDLVENLFPDSDPEKSPSKNKQLPVEETLIRIPGAMLHLIDKQNSIELGSGEFSIYRIRQAENVVAVIARIGDVQWPIARDAASVKLDEAHYFFALHDPSVKDGSEEEMLNYGLTFASKGQEKLLKELDSILASCSSFDEQKVKGKGEVLDGSLAKEVTPEEVKAGTKKELMEEKSAAYWTTLAPNVEEYSSSAAKLIARGSGMVIRGVIWCGDVTADRLKWGEGFLKRRMDKHEKASEISKDALKRMKRVKGLTRMSENVVTGILSGVVRVSGFFTSSVVNSKIGKKFFGLLPGEVVLASLDGFAKICDAAEMAGKNVLHTSSTVTTGLVSHKYGDQAAEVTHEGLGAAGHAIGTAWAVFKIRKALNPKSAMKPTSLAKSAAKSAAAELLAKGKK